MSVASKSSEHWTDDQLIAEFYGVGPDNEHLSACSHCRNRLSAMQASRTTLEQQHNADDDVSFDFLAAQRRKIYASLETPQNWWSGLPARRWASAGAAVLVLGIGFAALQESGRFPAKPQGDQQLVTVTDEQLAQAASQIAEDPDPQPTAPLQALFEE